MFALWSRPFDGDQIVPRVFLGSACTKESALTENEITHVVSVAKEHGVPVCRSVAHYFVVHVDDDPDENLLAVLDQCVAYIDNALNSSEDTRVFVHCSAGVSRSVTVMIAYLLRHHSMLFSSVHDALTIIRKHRPFAGPNHGFMRQLEVWHGAGCTSEHEDVRKKLAKMSAAPRVEELARLTTDNINDRL